MEGVNTPEPPVEDLTMVLRTGGFWVDSERIPNLTLSPFLNGRVVATTKTLGPLTVSILAVALEALTFLPLTFNQTSTVVSAAVPALTPTSWYWAVMFQRPSLRLQRAPSLTRQAQVSTSVMGTNSLLLTKMGAVIVE